MAIHSTTSSSSRAIPSHIATALLAAAMFLAALPVFAAGSPGGPGSGHPGPGNPGSGAHGRLLPLLPDGTPVEPSTWREESWPRD